ncbi:MAG: hypothetical protein E6R05_06155 [Candidatus Moraniibacteriota bacterium]|nr:MAG: hypothetical protein E6R05_06155 [Candidatus Moranbacteria bacterium]
MINDIVVGDITRPTNPADVIIGMNSTLSDVLGIGRPFVKKVAAIHPIVRGSVLSFKFTPERHLHMIICHDIGEGGWVGADQQVRFGMDYLWHTDGSRRYSIVQIGTGRVGKRDGADPTAIRSAIAASFLPVNLYVYDPGAREAVEAAVQAPLRAFRAWHPVLGEERIAA